jgi:O-Antigen ligase
VFARWLFLGTVFLGFTSDYGTAYADWFSPFFWTQYLFWALPWKLRTIDHIMGLCLLLAKGSKTPAVKPMRATLLLSMVTTVVWFLYGIMRGGDPWAGSWQIYLMLSGVLFAFTAAAVIRTPEHCVLLAKTILYAGAYRAFIAICYWALYVLPGKKDPEFLTSHDDSVLFVVCMLLLLLQLFNTSKPAQQAKFFLYLAFFGAAVLFNKRRIAWVSLAMGAAVLFAVLPKGRIKRNATKTLVVVAPVLLLYTAIGWGRPETIFKPLRSLSTVSTSEDTSTKARNVENLGLIATSNANNPLMGTGWGHPYIEVSNKYTIAQFFPLWQYIPHNSVLGLLAYTGILGFCGYWLAFPTAMFLVSRMAHMATTPLLGQVGAVATATLLVCANQFYGDMGIYYAKGVYFLSLSYALALRLPILAGSWPAPASGRGPTRAALRETSV